MYPNLYFIIKKITGWTPPVVTSVIQTYGLFLAITFVIGGYIIYKEMARKHQEGLLPLVKTTQKTASYWDIVINAIIGFIIGFKVLYAYHHYGTFINNPQDIVFSNKGSVIGGIIGAIIFGGLKFWDIQRFRKKHPNPQPKVVERPPQDAIGDIVIVAAISGIFGAKIFALIEMMDAFMADPLGMLFSGSGLAIYGGLIGGFIGVYFYARSKGIKTIHLMDAAAPALLLGYGTGRMGCHFSGDGDWGIPNPHPKPSWLPDWAWSYTYPNNVLGQRADTVLMEDCIGEFYTDKYCYELVSGVYPTSVYETTTMVILFAIFWFLRKRIKIAGLLFFMYLIVNGIERFLIEIIRVNDRYDWFFDFTQAQIVAIGFMVTGIVGGGILIWRHFRLAK